MQRGEEWQGLQTSTLRCPEKVALNFFATTQTLYVIDGFMFMELHIYTVGTYIMYYLDCKAIRVKSHSVGKVMFRSQSE